MNRSPPIVNVSTCKRFTVPIFQRVNCAVEVYFWTPPPNVLTPPWRDPDLCKRKARCHFILDYEEGFSKHQLHLAKAACSTEMCFTRVRRKGSEAPSKLPFQFSSPGVITQAARLFLKRFFTRVSAVTPGSWAP